MQTFRDRRDAGKQLAKKLGHLAKRKDVTVMALQRTGVPVAFEIARALSVALDVFQVRNLGAFRDRTVVLVDDAMATGESMRNAIVALRKIAPRAIVIGVPVASVDARDALRRDVDEIVCLDSPEDLGAVRAWYLDFSPPTDEEVRSLLASSGHATGSATQPSERTMEKACATCGNVYDKALEITTPEGKFTFDCFECAIHKLAPTCAHCACKVIGHGFEASGKTYCCAHCARAEGFDAKDRVSRPQQPARA